VNGPAGPLRLPGNACFGCRATDVRLVMTGRVMLGTRDEEAYILHCEPCLTLIEAARRRPRHDSTQRAIPL
jgi:hypothetical protein